MIYSYNFSIFFSKKNANYLQWFAAIISPYETDYVKWIPAIISSLNEHFVHFMAWKLVNSLRLWLQITFWDKKWNGILSWFLFISNLYNRSRISWTVLINCMMLEKKKMIEVCWWNCVQKDDSRIHSMPNPRRNWI